MITKDVQCEQEGQRTLGAWLLQFLHARTTAAIITLRQMIASVSCATVIRFFVYGLPALLLALIATAFVNVSLLSAKKKNEMSIGTLGEPSTLNPIQQADAAAGEVQAVIFNGLPSTIKISKSQPTWRSRFHSPRQPRSSFPTPNAAFTGLLSLETRHSQWKDWKLNSVRFEENRLVLELAEPGMENSQKIVSALKPLQTVPLQVFGWTCKTRPRRRSKHLRDGRRFSDCAPMDRILVRIRGHDSRAIPKSSFKKLEAFLAAKPELMRHAQSIRNFPFLAEPAVLFSLRDDVRWHDGEPFTSRDVVFTYRAIMDDATASPRKPDFLYILRIETPDPHTVRVIYRTALLACPQQLDDRNAARAYSRGQTPGMVGQQLQSQSRRHRSVPFR